MSYRGSVGIIYGEAYFHPIFQAFDRINTKLLGLYRLKLKNPEEDLQALSIRQLTN